MTRLEIVRRRVSTFPLPSEVFRVDLDRAQDVLDSDPRYTLVLVRGLLEEVVVDFHRRELDEEPDNPTLGPMMNKLTRHLPRDVCNSIHTIREAGNIGAHRRIRVSTLGVRRTAIKAMDEFLDVLEFYIEHYGIQTIPGPTTAGEPTPQQSSAPPPPSTASAPASAPTSTPPPPPPPAAYDPSQPTDVVRKADEACYRKADYATAHRLYSLQSRLQLGKDPYLVARVIDSLIAQNQLVEAESSLLEAKQQLSDPNGYLTVTTAFLHIRREKYQQAADLLAPADAFNENYPRGFGIRAKAARLLEDYQAAATHASRALTIDPNYTPAYMDRGIARQYLKDLMGSRSDLETFHQLNPGTHFTHYELGWTLYLLKQYQASIASCRTAVALKPDYDVAYFTIGLCSETLGKFPEAVEAHRKAIELGLNSSTANYNYASSLLKNKQYEESKKYCRKALSINADYEDAHVLMAKIIIAEKEYDKAYEYLQPLVAKYTKSHSLALQAGIALYYMDRELDSVEQYSETLRRHEANYPGEHFNKLVRGEIYYLRGMSAYHGKQYERAFGDMQSAHQLGVSKDRLKSVFSYRVLATYYSVQHKVEKAPNQQYLCDVIDRLKACVEEKKQAVRDQSYEKAAELRDEESKLRRLLTGRYERMLSDIPLAKQHGHQFNDYDAVVKFAKDLQQDLENIK